MGAAFGRADAALLRVRDEVQEFAGWRAEFHCRRFFERLRNVQAAQVNQFECSLDFISIFRTEPSAAQPNDVQAKYVIAFRCNHERWQILPE